MVKRGEHVGARDNPASYTPKHLAEKILTSRSALEGERKQVTVLFCDIMKRHTAALVAVSPVDSGRFSR